MRLVGAVISENVEVAFMLVVSVANQMSCKGKFAEARAHACEVEKRLATEQQEMDKLNESLLLWRGGGLPHHLYTIVFSGRRCSFIRVAVKQKSTARTLHGRNKLDACF